MIAATLIALIIMYYLVFFFSSEVLVSAEIVSFSTPNTSFFVIARMWKTFRIQINATYNRKVAMGGLKVKLIYKFD